MRIVHIAESLGGGLLEFIIKLVNYLPSDHHIIIFGKVIEGGWDNKIMLADMRIKFPENVEFYHWEGVQREINLFTDFKSLWTLQRILIKLEKFDAIHLHSSKAGAIGRVLFFLTRRKEPVYYTPHGAPFLRLDLSPVKQKFITEVERLANRLSGKIVCCSASEYNIYLEKGIQPFIYINNGTEINQNRPHLISRTFDEHKKIRICSVGRLTFQKNPILFNQIASAFLQDSFVEFIWIGDGELREEIKSPNIRVTGWITKQKVNQEVMQSHIYLSTSLWEGLPFAVLEAMSFNKPLLLKRVVGNVDLVKNNFNGSLYNNASDAIQILKAWINNSIEIIEKGNASFDVCKTEFNASVNFPKYRKLYDRSASLS